MMALRATAEGGERFAVVIDEVSGVKKCLHANNGAVTKVDRNGVGNV
jgi:hypothetical protein